MSARHRDFLFKRSLRAALPRANTQGQNDVPSNSAAASSSSAQPKTSDTIEPFTLPNPVTQPTDTPTTSRSSNTPSSPTPGTSTVGPSPSPSSPSPAHASSSSSTSSSTTSRETSSSSASTPLTIASPPILSASTAVITSALPGVSFTPSSALSSTPTSTAATGSSGGTNTGAIVGGIAGTLAGIAVLGFLLLWCMRRQRDREIDDFDAQAFKRQSAMLVDDPIEPPHSYNPRPPTMIERHNASPALAAQAGYGGQNFHGGYGGYGQQAPYAPAASPPLQGYGAPVMGYAGYNDAQQIVRQPSSAGHAAYDAQQQLVRQPSNAAYLTRQPSSAAPPVASRGPFDPNTQYIDLNRSSVSPYQAAQYADISRQLGAVNPNAQVPHESVELPDGPLPSPFDDPAEATPDTPHHPDHPTDVIASAPVTAPRNMGDAPESHQRPVTVYEEGDAYSGI